MPADGPHAQSVTIVNEAFARRYFGSLDVIAFQTSPLDPLTYIAVVALVVACPLTPALVPAIRATRVQPATALRYE